MACFRLAGHFIEVIPGDRSLSYTVTSMFLFQLCKKPLIPSEFAKSARYTYEANGRVIAVPLRLTRLKPDVIPSIFRNCPAYLCRPETAVREAAEEMRARLVAEALQEAI